MPWRQAQHKTGKVYARCADDGCLRLVGGRAQIAYQLGEAKIYRAAPADLKLLDDEAWPEEAITPQKDGKAKAATVGTSATPSSGEADAKISAPIIAYTDGACSGNPGDAGSGVVLLYGKYRREIGHYLGRATNNIAELFAVKMALEAVTDKARPLHLHADSSYAIGVLSRGWKAKKNPELVEEIRTLMAAFPRLSFVKVEGHAGVSENERADELARLAVRERKSIDYRYKDGVLST